MTADVNLSDWDFWGKPLKEREAAFARLRGLPDPVFYPEPEQTMIPAGPGYYALVRHADIVEASRRPQDFCSTPSAISIPDMPADLGEYFGSMISMDDPRHAKIRRIVSRAFSPRMLAAVDESVQRVAGQIVTDLVEKGPGDFVPDVASKLPLQIICDMMGIDAAHYDSVFTWSNTILGGIDPEYVGDDFDGIVIKYLEAGGALQELVQELGRKRRTEPTGDLTSALVNANIDGESLTDQELGSFFILLVVAGNETTRNAISHGLKLFTLHPDQRDLLLEDFEGRIAGAVEEIVRYSSPVIWMRRTATRDTELNGRPYKKGDKVVLYYWSANRDEDVFADPYAFDIMRSPNPHVGFGGPGPHFCLGANLARREITVMFRELFTRIPTIHSTAPPERLLSNFINGIKHLPCAW